MFYELREYRILPGQMDNWVNFMQEVIIPFQSGQGMIIVGSFTSTEEDDLYIWMRRFENEEDRVILYVKVYASQRDVLDWFSPWYEVITKYENFRTT